MTDGPDEPVDERERLDALAEVYEAPELHGVNRFFMNYLTRFLLTKAVPGNVLELGFGQGVNLHHLLRVAERLTIAEGSEAVLESARPLCEAAPIEVVLVHTLFEEMVFDERFDTIYANNVLEHLADPVAILKSLSRFLKPHGVVIVAVPHADSLHRRLGVTMGLIEHTNSLGDLDRRLGHRRVYTQALLRDHLLAAQLEIVESGGAICKPLASFQLEGLSPDALTGLCRLGHDLPELSANLYAVCRRKAAPPVSPQV